MLRQRNAQNLAREAELRLCIVETGNVKKPWIDSGEKAYKRRVTAFKLDCNIYVERLGGHHLVPNLLFLLEGIYKI